MTLRSICIHRLQYPSRYPESLSHQLLAYSKCCPLEWLKLVIWSMCWLDQRCRWVVYEHIQHEGFWIQIYLSCQTLLQDHRYVARMLVKLVGLAVWLLTLLPQGPMPPTISHLIISYPLWPSSEFVNSMLRWISVVLTASGLYLCTSIAISRCLLWQRRLWQLTVSTLKFFLFVAERDRLDECLGGPMTSFGLRSAPLSHFGDIDDDVVDDGIEWQ